MESMSVSLNMLHTGRFQDGVRHRRPHPPVARTHSNRSTTADDSSHPTDRSWDESLCVCVFFFFFFHLTYRRWTSLLPSCLWSQRIFPSLPGSRLTIFLSRCKFSTLTTRQPMVEFYLLTFPRFPLRKKEHKYYFGKNRTHDFRTSRCAAYLLDHSGDEQLLRPDNGVYSDWFEVEQGLPQIYVLSPLLFNLFFAAVLTVVLQRFSEDTVILVEMVHLKELPTSMGPESAMN